MSGPIYHKYANDLDTLLGERMKTKTHTKITGDIVTVTEVGYYRSSEVHVEVGIQQLMTGNKLHLYGMEDITNFVAALEKVVSDINKTIK